MDKITFFEGIDGVEMVLIDRGNNEYTSMTKAYYDQQQAAKEAQSL